GGNGRAPALAFAREEASVVLANVDEAAGERVAAHTRDALLPNLPEVMENPTPLPEKGEAGFRVEITYRQRFIRLPNGCSATGVSRGEQLLRFSLVLCAFARENAVGTQFAL
ncbi:MAG TPA: hypothetical protein VIK75_04070, partial [Calditerricola sp.]